MKITDDIVRALQTCVDNLGGIAELSRQTGVKIETITRFLTHKTQTIGSDSWKQLQPLIQPMLTRPVSDNGEQPAIIGGTARKHHDLVSLTSDEKILLDAFNALPAQLQETKLLELVDLACKVTLEARKELE